MTEMAREYWTEKPFLGAVREVPVPRPGDDEVLIETLASGVSRGTETLVHRGDVPAGIAHRMRAPHQLGDFPAPVSHGYLNVGIVREGPEDLLGQRVFTLSGHRSHVVVPAEACHVVPENCPTQRALLAGIAEVGLNAIWEAQVTLGDRVAVVGAGPVGLTAALLLRKVTPQRLMVVEVDASRREIAEQLGLHACSPQDAWGDNDVVFHTSSHQEGLARALEITGDDGAVLEMSWYGDSSPRVPLGADFHARRLRLLGTQVGEVAAPKRLRRSRRERLATALSILDEPFDTLVSGSSSLERLPAVMDDLTRGAEWTRTEILHAITYN